jgi:hypothetical protein
MVHFGVGHWEASRRCTSPPPTGALAMVDYYHSHLVCHLRSVESGANMLDIPSVSADRKALEPHHTGLLLESVGSCDECNRLLL